MRYEGSELIVLPESADKQTVQDRIDKWLNTETGQHYQVVRQDSEKIVLKKRRISWLFKLWIVGIAVSLIAQVLVAIYMGSFQLLIDMLLISGPPTVLMLLFIFLYISNRVSIETQIQDDRVHLNLKSNSKEEAEHDFDSLISTIQTVSAVEGQKN